MSHDQNTNLVPSVLLLFPFASCLSSLLPTSPYDSGEGRDVHALAHPPAARTRAPSHSCAASFSVKTQRPLGEATLKSFTSHLHISITKVVDNFLIYFIFQSSLGAQQNWEECTEISLPHRGTVSLPRAHHPPLLAHSLQLINILIHHRHPKSTGAHFWCGIFYGFEQMYNVFTIVASYSVVSLP